MQIFQRACCWLPARSVYLPSALEASRYAPAPERCIEAYEESKRPNDLVGMWTHSKIDAAAHVSALHVCTTAHTKALNRSSRHEKIVLAIYAIIQHRVLPVSLRAPCIDTTSAS